MLGDLYDRRSCIRNVVVNRGVITFLVNVFSFLIKGVKKFLRSFVGDNCVERADIFLVRLKI